MPSLIEIFRDKLIPWTQDGLDQRLIVARPVMKKSTMPSGVKLAKKEIVGERTLVRTHDDGPEKIIRARWLKDGLHELFIPKLVCVLDGITDYRVGKYVVTCGKGHFILVPAGTPNAITAPHLEEKNFKNGFYEFLQLIIFRESVKCSMSSYPSTKAESKDISCTIPHVEAVHLFHLFQAEVLDKQQESDFLCQQLLSSVFTFLLREVQAGRQLKRPRNLLKNISGDDEIKRMHEYIRLHLAQSLTIDKMAWHMHMSPAQFTRFVRQETGKSFVEILTMHRTEEATYLLCNTNWSVAAIARQLGFASANYFISFFGKHMGISPGAFRERSVLKGRK